MPKYLYKVAYSAEGMRGVMKEGAASRVDFIGKLVSNLGGQMESFHFAFGETDVYVINELPERDGRRGRDGGRRRRHRQHRDREAAHARRGRRGAGDRHGIPGAGRLDRPRGDRR